MNDDSVLCSDCFSDQGLRLDAERLGEEDPEACPICGSSAGKKLTLRLAEQLAHRFFVVGTLKRFEYGGAPLVQINESQKTSIDPPTWLRRDIEVLESVLGVGFFHYGPRFWMFGKIEPLDALRNERSRSDIIDRILSEYPALQLGPNDLFYRIRKDPKHPNSNNEFDSPPDRYLGQHRFDSASFPVLYGSPDLQVCVHECRVTAEDELYVATMGAHGTLRILDLTALIQEDVTEFESLDLAVHMLFLAGSRSYEISRDIARAASNAGFDGLSYPSYFSLLRTGATPFLTTLGMSHRRIPQYQPIEQALTVPNLAIFGRPVHDGRVDIRCINRLVIARVEYELRFGPVSC